MRLAGLVAGIGLAVVAASVGGACTTKLPQRSTYFDRTIAPILESSCVRTNTGAGCHVADDKGNAFGNLDLTAFAGIDRRRDLLLDYGPYQQPSLLVKNVPPYQLSVSLWDDTKIHITTDIKHTGLPIFDSSASAYQTLRRWIGNGATEDNTGVSPVRIVRTPCSHAVPSAPSFDPSTDPGAQDFPTFQQSAASVLQSCAAGNCHGTPVNALYLTCGETPEEVRWNYFAASLYLAATAGQSEIVRRPLATSQGGSYHEGGPLFASVADAGYVGLVTWAQAWKQGWGPTGIPPQWQNIDPAFLFFAQKVEPMFVKKGCMMVQCHSAAMFHDYRLLGGSAGSFSLGTTRKNYMRTVAQMSFESEDVNASRLVRKNLYHSALSSRSQDGGVVAAASGIAHRGGPLLEDFGNQSANAAACDGGNYDYDNGDLDTIPAYCVIREWHKRERAERKLAAMTEIVYVKRPPPPAPDRPQDFDLFAAGAALHIAAVTLATTGEVKLGMDRAVDLAPCGLGSAPDIRRPAVSWDGRTIAFAARAAATDPLAIYTIQADGTGCTKVAGIAAHDPMANGLLEHDFDPVFSPPGPDGIERIVFASTRGNLDPSAFGYSGPQPTPADMTKPNANLYVLEPDPSGAGAARVRQLTWQLNMERMPSFMQDGRLIFTAEKREPGFYQLALRRQNLDGGDYHPLFAQRGSIGYTQATYVEELSHKDFAAILSNQDALHGAGALGVFNRSLGVDFASTNPADYLVDPTVIDPSSRSSPEPNFFFHSLRVLATDGSYTSPSPLPGGALLVSFGAGDPAQFGGDYDLYVVDPLTGNKTKLLGDAGTAEVEAVAVYERVAKDIFASTPDEPNGHTEIRSGDPNADVAVLDMSVLASLLFQNTPTGRVVERDLKSFDVYEDLPPDLATSPDCSGNMANDAYGKVCVRRRLLGTVPLRADGSAHFRIPGGLPIVLHLADDSESRQMKLPRWQREELTFSPGEYAHQSFPGVFFDNLCAGCHGALSGRAVDASLRPDFLTQASQVQALAIDRITSDFTGPPSSRGAVVGPPPTP
jgi:hypothetical protein